MSTVSSWVVFFLPVAWVSVSMYHEVLIGVCTTCVRDVCTRLLSLTLRVSRSRRWSARLPSECAPRWRRLGVRSVCTLLSPQYLAYASVASLLCCRGSRCTQRTNEGIRCGFQYRMFSYICQASKRYFTTTVYIGNVATSQLYCLRAYNDVG
jgi:hypothetical protein